MKCRGIDRKLTDILPDLSVAHYLQNVRFGVDGELRWRRGLAKSSIAVQSGPVVAQGATNNKLGPFIAMQVGTTIEGLPSGAALWGDVSLQAPVLAVSTLGPVTITRTTLYARSFLLYSSTNRGNGPVIPLGEFTILPAQTTINTVVTDFATYYAAEEKAGSIVGPRCAWVAPVAYGSSWTIRTSAANVAWTGIVYGNSTFVAVAGGSATVMTSPTGTTWTSNTGLIAATWGAVGFGGGLFVAVGVDFGGAGLIYTSTDGVTWTSRTCPDIPTITVDSWSGVTYGNGIFVAVAVVASTQNIMTSPDGITWTLRTKSDVSTLTDVAFGGGVFVAVGTATASGSQVFTSPDGITWTNRTGAVAAATWTSVTYGASTFVAVRAAGTAATQIMYSTNLGVTWVAATSPEATTWNSVDFGVGLFVAIANTGTNRVMYSLNGITWVGAAAAAANNWVEVAFGGGVFAAVASSGTGNRVMTSP